MLGLIKLADWGLTEMIKIALVWSGVCAAVLRALAKVNPGKAGVMD